MEGKQSRLTLVTVMVMAALAAVIFWSVAVKAQETVQVYEDKETGITYRIEEAVTPSTTVTAQPSATILPSPTAEKDVTRRPLFI